MNKTARGALAGAPTDTAQTLNCSFPSNLTLPPHLQDGQEARGLLNVITDDCGQCLAVFDFGNIALPYELARRLEPLVGRCIAILRLDNCYYIHEVA